MGVKILNLLPDVYKRQPPGQRGPALGGTGSLRCAGDSPPQLSPRRTEGEGGGSRLVVVGFEEGVKVPRCV